jgi:hypothetical protein
MPNVLRFNQFTAISEKRYTISWDFYEGKVNKVNEEVYIVPTFHASNDRMNPENISMEQIKEIVDIVAPELISNYDIRKGLNEYIIRDRRMVDKIKGNPIQNNSNYFKRRDYMEDEGDDDMAIVGDFFDRERVAKSRRDPHFTILKQDDPLVLKIYADMTGEKISLKDDDYVFKVITCRRKRDFIQKNQKDIVIDVFDEYVKIL